MAQIFVSGVAHFFVVVGGSKIHERMAHFFIDIYTEIIRSPGTVLERMYAEAANACGEQLSFDSNSVSVTNQEFHKEQDSILVIRIEMPAPSSVLDCRAIYLCHSQRGGHNMLFSSELGSDGQYY